MSVETGILIRAEIDGKWGSADIGDDRVSNETIVTWLRSKGGANPFAENLLLAMLHRKQDAHEIPFWIESGDCVYATSQAILRTSILDGGNLLLSVTGSTGQASILVQKEDSRVYNGLMGLIKSIQVFHDENESKNNG